MNRYAAAHARSLQDPEGFWRERAQALPWRTFPDKILETDADGTWRWFGGGELNTCEMALDHHVAAGCGEQIAIIYDSPVTGVCEHISYAQLLAEVARCAGMLRDLGVGKGDRVVIYMPMIPEAVTAMLACARLGAVHSVVFGGFSPAELAVRIDHATPRVLLTASCGIEFERVIAYKPLIDQALAMCVHPPAHVLVKARPQQQASLQPGRDHDWDQLMAGASAAAPVPVASDDPLYILYTSGTTGKPKGIVRDNGGHAVALHYSMQAIYDIAPGEVYWAASDIGWVVGHSYIVYAPLLRGCTTILYEGKPVRTPDAGAFWRVAAQHRVSVLFAAPTAFRAIKREDPQGELLKQYDLTRLRSVFVAGERLDPPTWEWLHDHLQRPVLDHWWQTETGWPVAANPQGLGGCQVKPGSPSLPVPGYGVQIVDDAGQPLPAGESGHILLRLPLPPGASNQLWGDADGFFNSYLKQFPGGYLSGDGGYLDEEGYVFVMGRTDDVINVAGHRLSSGALEEVAGNHPDVAECAVIGLADALKGDMPVALAVLKQGAGISARQLETELVAAIRERVGRFAAPREVFVLSRLPKTRSGKILRKTIRALAQTPEVSVPPTIEDIGALDELRDVFAKAGYYHPGNQ